MGQQAQDVGRRTVFKTLAPPDGYLYTGPSGSGKHAPPLFWLSLF